MKKKEPIIQVEHSASGIHRIRVELSNGSQFRIEIMKEDAFSITSVDGAIIVYPKVSNQVLISNVLD